MDGGASRFRRRGEKQIGSHRALGLAVLYFLYPRLPPVRIVGSGAKLDPICGKIKNDDDRREAMSLARMFLSARDNAQRCAVDCAPYVHARLQAVHHEHGPTGRYVIADRPLTEAEWIAARADVIDITPNTDDQSS
jgi:hypothetical protein